MITSQMSYEELAYEVANDYAGVYEILQKKSPDAMKALRKQSRFPAFLSLRSLRRERINGF